MNSEILESPGQFNCKLPAILLICYSHNSSINSFTCSKVASRPELITSKGIRQMTYRDTLLLMSLL